MSKVQVEGKYGALIVQSATEPQDTATNLAVAKAIADVFALYHKKYPEITVLPEESSSRKKKK